MPDPLSPNPQNPYAPPSSAAEPWTAPPMAGAEPMPTSVPKVFGILSIIFASIVLCFGLITSCSGLAAQGVARLGDLAPAGSPKAAEVKSMMSMMAKVYLAMGIQGLVFTALSALLLAIGVGQVRYREWAGRWSVYWGGLALAALAGMVLVSILVIGPAYQRMFEAAAHAAPSGAVPSSLSSSFGGLFGGTFSGMMIFFYAPYPILLLIFFTKEHIRAAMNN